MFDGMCAQESSNQRKQHLNLFGSINIYSREAYLN